LRRGTRWYDGTPPTDLPPPNQVGRSEVFGQDVTFPALPPVELREGFDARCWIPNGDFNPPNLAFFLRPNVIDCCWQRVCVRILNLMSAVDTTEVAAVTQLIWAAPFRVTIFPLTNIRERWLWIEGPDFQIVFMLGTQFFGQFWDQTLHSFAGPVSFGPWASSRDWFDNATLVNTTLLAAGFDPDKPITFVGHSRGGATLFVLGRRYLDANPRRDIEILTFGCPKVGNANLIDRTPFRRQRHVANIADIVPNLPPPPSIWVFLLGLLSPVQISGFTNWIGFRVHQVLRPGRQPVLEPLPPLSVADYLSIITDAIARRMPERIEAHFTETYVAALAVCCPRPRFPFNIPMWQALFGFPDNAFGGLMVGASDVKGYVAGGGLELGGGDSPPDSILLESGDHVLTESIGYVLLE